NIIKYAVLSESIVPRDSSHSDSFHVILLTCIVQFVGSHDIAVTAVRDGPLGGISSPFGVGKLVTLPCPESRTARPAL
ncbi:hypothetical protein PMAYCL1PPCAC_20310, partial [Pristionchus mayeri]